MATNLAYRETEPSVVGEPKPSRDAAQHAFQILYIGFMVLPIVAGLDKFTHLLVNWDQYFSPFFAGLMGPLAPYFMRIVGVVEIVAGLVVAFAPRFGGYLVAMWLWGIIINLLSIPDYFDIALRDFGLSLGAIALARLADVRPQR
jgi:uncharacterized membrane protein YphA (DoxX/SURF4 family)